jgi:hypothetical protein
MKSLLIDILEMGMVLPIQVAQVFLHPCACLFDWTSPPSPPTVSLRSIPSQIIPNLELWIPKGDTAMVRI